MESNLTLVGLTASQRIRLAKMGNRNRPFSEKALQALDIAPTAFPASFDSQGYQNDWSYFGQLEHVENLLRQLLEKVRDTRIGLSSDLYKGSLDIYRYGKAADPALGLKPIMDDMAERFHLNGGAGETPGGEAEELST